MTCTCFVFATNKRRKIGTTIFACQKADRKKYDEVRKLIEIGTVGTKEEDAPT